MKPTSTKDELLEVVDLQGNVIGLEPRGKCHGDPSLMHRAVHIFVRNRRGDLFLQKRSLSKDIQPGKWDTSVGGHLDPGESFRQAAIRELHEELGIVLGGNSASQNLILKHKYVWNTAVETELIETYELIHEGPFVLHPEEIDEGRFWTDDELRDAIGKGLFTPNLEEELRRLSVT